MIRSFADKVTAAVFSGQEVRRMAKSLQAAARRKLMMLDAASSLDTLKAVPLGKQGTLGASELSTTTEASMTIKREELNRADWSDVTTGRRLAPVHPGEVLVKEFIQPMKLTRYKVAKGTGVPQRRIDEICSGNRGITADTALRLGRFFGMEAQFWMSLQGRHDLDVAERASRKRIEREVTPLKEAA